MIAMAEFYTKTGVEKLQQVGRTFDKLADLLAFTPVSMLPPVVRTVGHTHASDQGGMEWSVVTWTPQPTHVWSKIGIRLDAGHYLIPRSLRTAPVTAAADARVVADLDRRGRTFVTDKLIWDPSRVSPLHDTYARGTTGKEPITCSQFAGMLLSGYDYEHTKYVADANTAVGALVRFNTFGSENPWQAHRMARWAYVNGDFWALTDTATIAAGDVLFFSEQNPENAGNTYFGNIYHVGVYLGDGKIIQSKSASDPTGVVVEELAGMSDKPSFAWRPNYDTALLPQGQGDAAIDELRDADKALDTRVKALEDKQVLVVIGPTDPVPSLPAGTLVVRRGD